MSAVLKPNNFETIFDFKPTEAELDYFLGRGEDRETQEEYLEFMTADGAYGDIYHLLYDRGDIKQATAYLDRIADARHRQSVSQPSCQDDSPHRINPALSVGGQAQSAT